jgi:hypothetical protein
MKIKSVKIISLLLAILMLVPFLTACSETGRDILTFFVQEWIKSKFGIDIADNSTTGKFIAGLKLIKLFTEDSTGNPDADAALGTVKMLKNFKDAETLVDQGRNTDNATAIDMAIKLRPDDWSYRVSSSTLAFKKNDLEKGRDAWKKGEDLAYADKNPTAYLRFYSQSINELEAWKNTGQLDTAPLETQLFTYGQLTSAYAGRYSITKDPKDKQMQDYYDAQWSRIDTKIGNPPRTTPKQ